MASQSPKNDEEIRDYENAWAALTQLMDSGRSWSGHERNCCYVNLGDGTFAEIAALAGVDFEDDGRALAATDWDGDGDLDVWLRNRTGPQLRFLQNDGPGDGHWISLALTGATSNRDGVGARVEVWTPDRRQVRELTAGSGYLSQSSKWLHFGLGEAEHVERIVVHWPGGDTQELGEAEVDHRYRIVEDRPDLEEVSRGVPTIRVAPVESTRPTSAGRIVLRTPMPVAPSILRPLVGPDGEGKAHLVQLWAQWCAPCIAELEQLAPALDELGAEGLRIHLLSVDEPEDQEAAEGALARILAGRDVEQVLSHGFPSEATRIFLATLQEHLLGKSDRGALPTSFLVDIYGYVQIVYLGPVTVEQLRADASTFGREPARVTLRSQYPGRWFFGMPRDLRGFAEELEVRGRADEAAFYEALAERKQFRER